MRSRKEAIKESTVTRQTLDDSDLRAALCAFSQLLNSALGPHGHIQAVQNSIGGPLTLTTSSARLFSSMSFSRPCIRLIVAAIQGHLENHRDGGLLSGSLCLHLITKALEVEETVSRKCVREVYEWMFKYVDGYVSSGSCRVRLSLDVSNIKTLLACVRSVLTKPVCPLLPAAQEHMSRTFLKAFLSTISEDVSYQSTSDRVFTLTFNNTDILASTVIDGLLLEWPEKSPMLKEQKLQCILDPSGNLRVALISVSMSGDAEEVLHSVEEVDYRLIQSADQLMMTKMIDFCDWLISRNVGLLLCQKVVHPRVKWHLRSNGIHFVERLGIHPIGYIQDLTGASSIGSVMVYPAESAYGYLSSVSHQVLHNKSFLHLEKPGVLCTLVLCCPLKHQLSELKCLAQSALSVLRSFLDHPFALCGGGCWLIHMSHFLKRKAFEHQEQLCADLRITNAQLVAAVSIFAKSLEATAKCLVPRSFQAWSDASHGHCWPVPPGFDPTADTLPLSCACGLLSDCDVKRHSMHMLTEAYKWTLFENGDRVDHFKKTDNHHVLDASDEICKELSNISCGEILDEDNKESEGSIAEEGSLGGRSDRTMKSGQFGVLKEEAYDMMVMDSCNCMLSALHTAVITAVSVLSISQYIHDVN